MTLQGLSSERERFSRSILTPQENSSARIPLAKSHNESFPSALDEAEGGVLYAEPRRRVLDRVVRKLSVMEIGGKEHVEEYVRYQYRSYCRPNTIRNSYNALESFVRFLKRLGKSEIKEVEKGDLEAFVEHEQDRG